MTSSPAIQQGIGDVRGGLGISVRNVSKHYGRGSQREQVLDSLDLDVAAEQFVCLLGRSGCGKSTLLNLVAGLERPSQGSISTGGRQVGVMFQEDNLFPWLTVGGNIELALKLSHVPRAERAGRVTDLLETVRLPGLQKLRPHEISGGMRQRVALAKTLAQDCSVLLMDEPFGALDTFTREAMHDEIERIWSERRLTILFVTHDAREAVRLADRVIVMATSPGRIDTEVDIPFERPRHRDSPDIAVLATELSNHIRRPLR